MPQRQIVYVLSTNYAGSHLLALQLGSHSECLSIGEFHRYRWARKRGWQMCQLCERDESCPMFRGLIHLPLRRLHGQLFENIRRMSPRVHTVVDNCKKPHWPRRFLQLPGVRSRFIHLIRDPRALARRWTLSYPSAAKKSQVRRHTARRCWRHGAQILSGSEANVYAWKWTYENQRITRFLNRRRLDARVVTYRDLVLQRDRVLRRLMEWLGMEFEPEQTRYWESTHHGSVKSQYMQAPPGDGPALDQRWREFLDHRTQREVATHPAVRKYLAQIGLCLVPSGLVSSGCHAGTADQPMRRSA